MGGHFFKNHCIQLNNKFMGQRLLLSNTTIDRIQINIFQITIVKQNPCGDKPNTFLPRKKVISK